MRGGIQKKGNYYYAVVYDGIDPGTGRKRRSWIPAGTRRSDAEKILAEEIKRRHDGVPVPTEKLTFGQYLTDRWLPILLALVVAGGPTGLKGADLLSLYEDTDFDPEGETAERALHLFDRLQEVAAQDRGALRTRWDLVDLFLSIMRAERDGLTAPSDEVMRFFLEFEAERREGTVALSDLRSTVVGLSAAEVEEQESLELPEIAPDMLLYLNAFAREGATKENVEVRSEVMFSRLRASVEAP